MKMIEYTYALTPEESAWWEKTIKDFRAKYMKTPREYIDLSVATKKFSLEDLSSDVESLLINERESVYELFLKDEAVMNGKVVAHLIQNRPIPKTIYSEMLEATLLSENLSSLSVQEIKDKTAEMFGEYTGAIFPYLYALSLSSTNSRRARAGQTFEMLIEKALDIFMYPYQNQSSLGTDFFKSNRIGKKVDLIIPGRKAYEQRRTACGIVSVKTSLRERWQEVVEELNRSNVRHIYLATLDDSITQNQIDIMKEYNITLIVRKSEKSTKFPNAGSVESFETFFNTTIPHLLEVWPGYLND